MILKIYIFDLVNRSAPLFKLLPSGHTTQNYHHYDVKATSRRHFDVIMTLSLRRVPVGLIVIFESGKKHVWTCQISREMKWETQWYIWKLERCITRGRYKSYMILICHDDVIKWKHFLRCCPLCGEFAGHRWIPHKRPVTQSIDVLFDPRLDKPSSKQSRLVIWDALCPLWRHCNVCLLLAAESLSEPSLIYCLLHPYKQT